MSGLFARAFRRLVLGALGPDGVRSALAGSARLFGVDPLLEAYRSMGVLNYETPQLSGEEHLIRTVLPQAITAGQPILFDVGANQGEMSLSLRQAFPAARIVAFEPNPLTYERLVVATASSGVECLNLGLGATASTGTLHSYRDNPTSGHASMYRNVFRLHEGHGTPGASELTSFEFPIGTLDAVCADLHVERIHFLKIDVEGHELEVLRGAGQLLAGDCIDAIQFEFNEMNVLSRTFLRDFYELLPRFQFFRLASRHLIPLGEYATRNEIFQFQNILAVRDRLHV